MSWIFLQISWIFWAHLYMMHQCTCKSLAEWVHKHLYQLQGVDAPAHVSLRPNCGPWKMKGILVLWHCWRYETNSALILLYYCFLVTTIFLDDFNGNFSACCVILCRENVLKFKKKFFSWKKSTVSRPGRVSEGLILNPYMYDGIVCIRATKSGTIIHDVSAGIDCQLHPHWFIVLVVCCRGCALWRVPFWFCNQLLVLGDLYAFISDYQVKMLRIMVIVRRLFSVDWRNLEVRITSR